MKQTVYIILEKHSNRFIDIAGSEGDAMAKAALLNRLKNSSDEQVFYVVIKRSASF